VGSSRLETGQTPLARKSAVPPFGATNTRKLKNRLAKRGNPELKKCLTRVTQVGFSLFEDRDFARPQVVHRRSSNWTGAQDRRTRERQISEPEILWDHGEGIMRVLPPEEFHRADGKDSN